MSRAAMFPALRFLNVPNAVTTLSAASGFASIVLASRGSLRLGLSLVVVSILADRLDGTLARRFQQATDFGRELDSLADAVSFCVAPALIGAFVGGWPVALPALLYCLAGVWRLGYFNVTGMVGAGEQQTFVGVPTTVAASWFVIAVAGVRALAPAALGIASAALFVVLALAMISKLPFRKHGLLVKSLYVLLPVSLAAIWLR